MKKDTLIVFESIYNNNTGKLARIMAHTLGSRLVNSKEAIQINLNEYKAIGFGSGIYFGCHHPEIFEVVKTLDHSEQDVFIFSTRGAPVLGKYHEPLKKILRAKGKKIVGEFSARGYDETGPWVIIGGGNRGKPDEKDLKKAVKFLHASMTEYCMPDYYKKVKTRLHVIDGYVNTYNLKVNETPLVLKGDVVTINQSTCAGCGICAKICPLGIIGMIDEKATPLKELDCTLCRLCEINCRERAINIHYSWRDAINVAKRHNNKVALY